MIAPTDLPSSDSLDGLTVETPDSADPSTLVCSANCGGLRCAPHCAQRFATARWFLATLLALALALGAVRGYVTALAHVIGERYALPAAAVDWLLVGAEASQGAAALLLAHGGARSHRPSGLGAPAFLHAGACFAALVPFVTPHGTLHGAPERNATEWLCNDKAPLAVPEGQPCWLTLVTMVALQVSAGVASSALLTHGITYLDDNVSSADSPTLIGAVLGADRLGPPLGQVFAYLCATSRDSQTGQVVAGGQLSRIWWLGFPLLGSVLIAVAVMVSMFPVRLPAAAVRERANCILNVVCGRVRIDNQPVQIDDKPGLLATIIRLISNKLLCFTMLFLMFLYIPMYNLGRYENRYLESVYFIPEPEYSGGVFKDQWTSRVTTGFLKPPIVLMVMLLSGMIIARKRPKISSLALWNAIMVFLTGTIFLIYSFLGCANTVRGLEESGLQLNEKCNAKCSCPPNIPFLPVCDRHGVESFYSPCHAGCETVENLDNVKLYHECKCITYDRRAKGGACSSNCTSRWVIYQSLGVIFSGLIGSCLVGSTLICLRCVSPKDKTAALGFVLTHIGATHLPGKYIYKVTTDAVCIYWGDSNYNCQLFDPQLLPFAFNLLTAGFLLLSFSFGMLAWSNSKFVKLFHDEFDEPDSFEMNEIRRKLNARLSTPFTRRRGKSKPTSDSSEEEEENTDNQQNFQQQNMHLQQSNFSVPQTLLDQNEFQQSNSQESERQPLQHDSNEQDSEQESEYNSENENEHESENDRQAEVGSRRVWRATLI